jgi:hypothetical protein
MNILTIAGLIGNQMIEIQPIMRRVRGGYYKFNSEKIIILMPIFGKKKNIADYFDKLV